MKNFHSRSFLTLFVYTNIQFNTHVQVNVLLLIFYSSGIFSVSIFSGSSSGSSIGTVSGSVSGAAVVTTTFLVVGVCVVSTGFFFFFFVVVSSGKPFYQIPITIKNFYGI